MKIAKNDDQNKYAKSFDKISLINKLHKIIYRLSFFKNHKDLIYNVKTSEINGASSSYKV
jgi:hypothetical protein